MGRAHECEGTGSQASISKTAAQTVRSTQSASVRACLGDGTARESALFLEGY